MLQPIVVGTGGFYLITENPKLTKRQPQPSPIPDGWLWLAVDLPYYALTRPQVKGPTIPLRLFVVEIADRQLREFES